MASVLIVEDEAQVLILAESVLQRAGYETLTAGTLAEAQAIINSDTKLDLVFTDITLGAHENGGITVGQLVKQARDGTPLLYTTGRPQTDGMQSLFDENKSKFLPKPYTEQQLTEAVATLLAFI
jgi:DNA-binding NtrC family response regulator